MNPEETCAWCPRLCRHVCPVAVATGLESATPTAMMTAVLLGNRGLMPKEEVLAATRYCLDCGACTSHCLNHIPVATTIFAARKALGEQLELQPLQPVQGSAQHVVVLTGSKDWSGAWSRKTGLPAASIRTEDQLGYRGWRHQQEGVLERLAVHFAGKILVSSSPAIGSLAQAAGLSVVLLAAPEDTHSCGALCCGQKDKLPQREPDIARVMVQRLLERGEERLAFAEQACADWVKQNGGKATGPEDLLE